jgi:UDP-N-acetylmuramoylalanine--D-glutamate ligase
MARSGLAAARLVKRLGGRPFVSDFQDEDKLSSQIAELRQYEIEYEAGGHSDRLLENVDYLVVSPGVPGDIPIIVTAESRGVPVFSELELAYWLCDAHLAAITGSNGKTTTTSLLGEIYKSAGFESATAGNIGYPLSEVSDSLSAKAWVSLEVSSFQLERIFEFRPEIGMILNLTPDHLDRYGRFEDYAETKLRIAENMSARDNLIINADDDYLCKLADDFPVRKVYFSRARKTLPGVYLEGDEIKYEIDEMTGSLGTVERISIPGPHNLENAMAAGAAALLAGVPAETISDVFEQFPGVEHRLEYVATIDGVRFVNDSKATNVDSVWYALQSVAEKIVLILGGKYKGGDLERLNELITQKVRHIVLIGEATSRMREAYEPIVNLSRANSLEEAVRISYEVARENDTVLLSPACASFDMFRDYEHRGQVFKQAVRGLKKDEKE